MAHAIAPHHAHRLWANETSDMYYKRVIYARGGTVSLPWGGESRRQSVWPAPLWLTLPHGVPVILVIHTDSGTAFLMTLNCGSLPSGPRYLLPCVYGDRMCRSRQRNINIQNTSMSNMCAFVDVPEGRIDLARIPSHPIFCFRCVDRKLRHASFAHRQVMYYQALTTPF